jgi:hypothetical protein
VRVLGENEMPLFRAGDLIVHKTDPTTQMVVTSVQKPINNGDPEEVWCEWFVKGEKKAAVFPPASLEKVDPKKSKSLLSAGDGEAGSGSGTE